MDSFIYALVMVPALRELLPRSGIAAFGQTKDPPAQFQRRLRFRQWRLLERHRLVTRDAQGRFVLGPRIAELATAAGEGGRILGVTAAQDGRVAIEVPPSAGSRSSCTTSGAAGGIAPASPKVGKNRIYG